MDIIALFCDIDYCLFPKDKQIVAYSMEGNSAGWDLHIRRPKKGRCGLKPHLPWKGVSSIEIDSTLQ